MMFGQRGCCELPGLGSAVAAVVKTHQRSFAHTAFCAFHNALPVVIVLATTSRGQQSKYYNSHCFSDEASEGQAVSGAVSPRTG